MTPDEQPQPVAWRYRKSYESVWRTTTDKRDAILGGSVVEPLYAHPPTSAASLDAVRVTDEMAERVCKLYATNSGNRFDDHYAHVAAISWMKDALEAALNPPAESSDISTPRPTDCAAIRSGEVVVMCRDAEGNAVGPFMVKT